MLKLPGEPAYNRRSKKYSRGVYAGAPCFRIARAHPVAGTLRYNRAIVNRNRPFLSFFLALLLLLTQQAAIAHATVHGLERTHSQQEQPLPHEQHCDQCHACAELGSILPSTFALPLTPVQLTVPASLVALQPELPATP